jgi:ABC-2 type transport system ATP-binding protein
MEILIENQGKRYGRDFALRQFSLHCEPGLLGLVGPNGAGKTTLMRMIATLLEPTEGEHRPRQMVSSRLPAAKNL